MKRITTLTLVLLLATTVLPAVARSGPPPGSRQSGQPGERPGGDPMVRLIESLDLDDGQAEQVRAILEEHRSGDFAQIEREHRAARQELDRLVFDPAASPEAVAAAAAATSVHAEQAALARHQLTLELATVLTAEQLTTLQQQLQRGRPGRRPNAR